MENMVGVINDNLKSVIQGIVEHREKIERDLAIVENEIDEHINMASKYKSEVLECRDNISNLEDEIISLENDLEELNAKFASKDLESILTVGNKEINSKIIEKRSIIDSERLKIADTTEKVKEIKDKLLDLKAKKIATTEELSTSKLLEKFFGTKINDIINITENHINEVYLFDSETPESEELETANIENNVDGSIFEEIDNFDIDKLDDDELKNAIKEEIEDTHSDNDEVFTEDIVTEELDHLIDEAGELIDKTLELKAKTDDYATKYKEKFNEEPIINSDNNSIDEAGLDSLFKDEFTIEPVNDIDVDLNSNNDIELVEGEMDFGNLDELLASDDMDVTPYNEKDDVIPYTGETDLEQLYNEMSSNDEIIEEEKKVEEIDDAPSIVEEIQKPIDEYEDKTDYEEVVENTDQAFKEILNKHNMDPSLIDRNKDVVAKMDPSELDVIISLLKRNGISSENLKNVFELIDDINVSKLEKAISKKRDTRLTDLLYQSIDANIPDTLGSVLDLGEDELTTLRKNVGDDLYSELNMFSNIVKMNIESLKKYNIDNLMDCILTHPSRFLDNPDQFEEMLDRYDPADLVRCINKNPAVLDKL